MGLRDLDELELLDFERDSRRLIGEREADMDLTWVCDTMFNEFYTAVKLGSDTTPKNLSQEMFFHKQLYLDYFSSFSQ